MSNCMCANSWFNYDTEQSFVDGTEVPRSARVWTLCPRFQGVTHDAYLCVSIVWTIERDKPTGLKSQGLTSLLQNPCEQIFLVHFNLHVS
jgi:hypothetical protein